MCMDEASTSVTFPRTITEVAKTLGLTISAPLRLRATQLIE